jgi:hypothetical protein
MRYILSVRQILYLTVLSAILSAVAVAGFFTFGTSGASAADETNSSSPLAAGISDPATATDERNNIEVYRAMRVHAAEPVRDR